VLEEGRGFLTSLAASGEGPPSSAKGIKGAEAKSNERNRQDASKKSEKTPTKPSFDLRAWSFVINGGKEYLQQVTERAVPEACGYGITHLEFFNMALALPSEYVTTPVAPCRNWVLCGLTFRDFPKLARHDVLHSGTAGIARAEREADLDYTRRLFGRVKAAGLKVMAHHHLRRDLPDELFQEYPQSLEDASFQEEWEEATLTEFFELLPEVDMLVVTSMTETPSILDGGHYSQQVDRLAGVFGAMERACRGAGKMLAIRDWGAVGQNQRVGPIFQEAMARMPREVCIHIKNVVLDYVTNREIPHPNLTAYPERPLIVEFDTYGEYYGRADIPYVDPQHFCERLDGLYYLQPYGLTARICYECDRAGRRYPTIFESPNAANAVVFARWAADASKNQPLAEWLDFLSSPRRWQTYYWEWLADRYGTAAGPLLAKVFERTPQIVHGIFAPLWTGYWHPFSVLEHTALPWPPTRQPDHGSVPWSPPPYVDSELGDNDLSWVVGWLTPGTPLETIGWSQLVGRKNEGLRLARLCSQEIFQEGPGVLSRADFADLTLLFRQLVCICEGDVLTGQILATIKGPNSEKDTPKAVELRALALRADTVAQRARKAFGHDFFGEFSLRMERWAAWARTVAEDGS
jgi:hypothetical protein